MADQRPPTIDPAAARHGSSVAPAQLALAARGSGAPHGRPAAMDPAGAQGLGPLGTGTGRLAGPGAARAPLPQGGVLRGRKPAEARRGGAGAVARPWWRRWAPARHHGPLPDACVQMLWANMALHMSADPQALIAQWHRALATDGFLMFSCLGPDTLRELRALYAALGWPPPAHDFTDMHDWGDMLVHAGFAEPVMDMERITLTWETPAAAAGRNCANSAPTSIPARFAALRGRGWRARLDAGAGAVAARTRRPAGPDVRDHLRPRAQTGAPRANERAQRRLAARTCGPCWGPTSARASSRAGPRSQECSPRYNAGLIFERHPCRIRYFVSPLSRARPSTGS